MSMDNKPMEAYAKQEKLSFVSLLMELPNFIAVSVAVVLTRSLITWVDLIDSFGNIASITLVWLIARKLKTNQKYAYNYGVEKLESISALVCDSISVAGLLAVAVSSVYQIINPVQTSELMYLVVILKIVNVSVDSVFFLQQYKLLKKNNSTLLYTEFNEALKALAFDAAALLAVFACWILRKYPVSWYISPVFSIALAVIFIYASFTRIKKAIVTLTDKTLPEEEQFKILKALNACYDDYDDLVAVNSHYRGNKVVIDLVLKFAENTTYSQIQNFLQKMTENLAQQMDNFEVSLVISAETEEEKICDSDQ